jgi:hypothetical protein
MTTTNFYILAEPLEADQEVKEQHRSATEETSATRSKVEREPEARLWKVCAEAVSPRFSGFEWVALLVFAASALAALVCGFSELFHLFNSGALDETVRALLTR